MKNLWEVIYCVICPYYLLNTFSFTLRLLLSFVGMKKPISSRQLWIILDYPGLFADLLKSWNRSHPLKLFYTPNKKKSKHTTYTNISFIHHILFILHPYLLRILQFLKYPKIWRFYCEKYLIFFSREEKKKF